MDLHDMEDLVTGRVYKRENAMRTLQCFKRAIYLNDFILIRFLLKCISQTKLINMLNLDQTLLSVIIHNSDELFDDDNKIEIKDERYSFVDDNRILIFLASYPQYSLENDLIDVYLRKSKIDLNIQDATGLNVLMFLCKAQKDQYSINLLYKLITNKNCDLNMKDKKGRTALILVCRYMNPEYGPIMIELLINSGRCDLNKKDKNGITALMYLSRFDNKEDLVQLFLESGVMIESYENSYFGYFDMFKKEIERREHIIKNIKQRNAMGILLLSMRSKKILLCCKNKKRNIHNTEDNPLNILPKELIHLTLSYAYPLASQTKYCKN